MAFGKEASHLANIYGFGGNLMQKAKTAARRPTRTAKGSAFYWKDTYHPSEIQADIVRLIPGDYRQQFTLDGENVVEDSFPFVIYREHHNGKRGCICSGGPLWANSKLAQPCPSCTIFWEDVRERKAKKARGDNTKGPNRMSTRDQFAFTVWDYSLYFEVPDVDSNGQYRMNPKTNSPYTHWEKGNQNDPQYQGRPWKLGNLLPWSMSETNKNLLLAFDKEQVGKTCVSCKSRGSIYPTMRVCGNPQCQAPIYDPNNCTLTPEQREQIDNYPYACQKCGQTGYSTEQIACSVCTQPRRTTLFDVDLQVQLIQAGDKKMLQIWNFSEPRPIQVADPEVLKTIQPLDLLKKFAPTPPETQMKIYGFQQVAAPTPPPAAMPQMPHMGAPMGMPQAPQYQPQPVQYQNQQQAPQQNWPQQPAPAGQFPASPYGNQGGSSQ